MPPRERRPSGPATTTRRPGPDAGPSEVVEVDTPYGPARAHLWSPRAATVHRTRRSDRAASTQRPTGRIVLGHGAGGGVEAADLVAVRAAATAAGWQVVLVEQPWRVAGRRVAAPPPRLDVGWRAVLTELAARPGYDGPLVVGGRSAGARVACRTAAELGADAVCCLAFPLHPPGRPERSRADELALAAGAGIEVLVVQGARDPFGSAADVEALGLPGVEVVEVPGDHALKQTEPVARSVVDRLVDWARR